MCFADPHKIPAALNRMQSVPVIIIVYLNMYVAPYRIWNVGNT